MGKSISELMTMVDAVRDHDYDADIAKVEASGVSVSCRECGEVLTAKEVVFYSDRCGQCEGEWLAAVTAWKAGQLHPEQAQEFERLYGSRAVTLH